MITGNTQGISGHIENRNQETANKYGMLKFAIMNLEDYTREEGRWVEDRWILSSIMDYKKGDGKCR